MASRTRIISQNKAVYASTTGIHAGGTNLELKPQQLNRIDTLSFDIDLAGSRQDIREFGQLSRIGVQTMSDIAPSVSLGYYLGDGKNEILLGLYSAGAEREITTAPLTGSIVSGITAEDPDYREKNLYVVTSKEGEDAFNQAAFESQRASHDVIGFGNCVLTNYTANFAVGEIPRADVEMEASNIVFWTGASSGLRNPAIDEDGGRVDAGMISLPAPNTGADEILVLRPDDVHVEFESNNISSNVSAAYNSTLVGGTHFGDVCVQSCSVELPLSRGNIECLGKERAYAKPLEFPINVTLNMSAVLKNFSAGSLERVLTGTAGDNKTNIKLSIKRDNGDLAQYYEFKNCYLDNQSFSQGLDDNETVDLTFSTQIGGSSNTNEGIFWSGQAGATANVASLLAKGTAQSPADGFFAHQPLSPE